MSVDGFFTLAWFAACSTDEVADMSGLALEHTLSKVHTLNARLEAWRYPGDSALRELLLSEEPIRRAVESSKVLRERNSVRTRLLASAVAVEARILPHLATAVERLNTQFPQVGQVECFVYNASDVNDLSRPVEPGPSLPCRVRR